ncbi:hypothetical protein LCGC14_1870120 [marine sediment metagenome]|uniref:F5/8 type C domain-containing protein n=1 Tax=marine sediment metagenome TaxID=412755 RepID=A0A0F9G570_9ZZZZ
MAWKSPDTAIQISIGTSWNEASIPNVKDDNTATYAYTGSIGPSEATKIIEMGLSSAIKCDKIRIWGIELDEESDPGPPSINLSVYHDGSWDDIWNGLISEDVWVTIQLGGTYLVSKARVYFQNIDEFNPLAGVRFNEFDFNQVGIVRPLIGNSGLIHSPLLSGGLIG